MHSWNSDMLPVNSLWATKLGGKKMSLIWLIYSVAATDHHFSVGQHQAQHWPAHRSHSINICGVESLLKSLKCDVSLSLIDIRRTFFWKKGNRENIKCINVYLTGRNYINSHSHSFIWNEKTLYINQLQMDQKLKRERKYY